MNWYLKVMRQYADFNGRARRKEYWMFSLINILIILPFYVIMVAAISSGNNSLYSVLLVPFLIYALAIFIPSLAVTVRRLHDVGKSGWWYFISLVPLIGGIWLLVLMCTDSQSGTNEWGENPKEDGDYNVKNFENF